MKTLPDGWSTYIDDSFTVAYMIRIDTLDGSTLCWSTKDTNSIVGWIGDRFYGGRLEQGGLGQVSMTANIEQGGGVAAVSDFTFTLLNQDGYYDDTLAALYLYNAPVIVRRFMIEAGPSDFDDGLDVFQGRITKVFHDRHVIEITCSADESGHNTIPRKLIAEKEFPSTTYEIPDNSVGKPAPIVFGELDHAELIFCNAKTSVLSEKSLVTGAGNSSVTDSAQSWATNEFAEKDVEIVGGEGKGQIAAIKSNTADTLTIYDTFQTNPAAGASIYRVTDTEFDMVISDREIKEWIKTDGLENIWFWDNTAELFIPFNTRVISFVDFPKPGMSGFRFLPGVVKKKEITFFYPYTFSELRNTGGYTNPENCIGYDRTTYASAFRQYGEAPPGSVENIQGRFGTDLSDFIGAWDALYMFLVGNHDLPTYIAELDASVRDQGDSVMGGPYTKFSTNQYFNSIPRNLYLPPSGYPDGANAVLVEVPSTVVEPGDYGQLNYNRWFQYHFLAYPFDADHNIYIYDIGLVFAKTIALNEQTRIFAQIKGRTFGDTWGGRKTAAELIQNPADVIEKLLRDDLSISGSDIDTAAFDQVSGSDRSGWTLAYQITKEIDSIDEIDAICRECFLLYMKKFSGEHSLVALTDSGGAVKTLSNSDILIRGDDFESTLKIDDSPLKNVYNEFYVHYKKHPVTGDYEGVESVTEPDQSSYDSSYTTLATEASDYWDLVHESWQRYQFKRTKHFYLDRVRDAATAELFLKFAIRWFYLQKQIVSFDTQLQNCDIEIGDIIALDSTITGASYFLYDMNEDLTKDEITLKMRKL